ncbi:glycosyltransferase family protein 64 C3 [Cinnamomum micranthum f. kanehirae]|uniref:Glycosyltransferase family protein 64 C3 n=1 Tax=Cinnamomum micranthum f. kanehirae TaxID=337451 RepID=A0A443PLC0_9MAGN|nr:glycosyltransferase family protein 64 C3 [Cinnamomum micranthum f. kanehirae]
MANLTELGSQSDSLDLPRAGECIREFHRGIGRMPLRYSYGKVIEGVGAQALCEKGVKLVLCEE